MLTNEVWFPSVIWRGTITDIDNTVLKEYGYTKVKEEEDLRLNPDPRNWRSTMLSLEECAEVSKLVNVIDQGMFQVSQQVGLRLPQLYNIWININYPGASNDLHNHINAMFSGVYYVDVDPNIEQGDIIFERNDGADLHLPEHMIEHYTYYTGKSATYTPKTGDLFIFPGWLKHRVSTNNSQQDRISIAFNYGE